MNTIPPAVQRMIVEINRCARMSWLGDDALLTPEQVAIIKRVSLRSVANQRRDKCLPPAVRLGSLVRWRLQDLRERIRGIHVLLTEQVYSENIPQRPDTEPFTYEHMAMILNCSIRMVAKLRADRRLPTPFKHHPVLWRPSDIHRWVMSRCQY
jgi:predicted DNA-binding transcriptional regulator AlpA